MLLRCLLGSAMLRPFPVRVACEVVVAGLCLSRWARLEVWPAGSGYHVERWVYPGGGAGRVSDISTTPSFGD